MEYDFFNAADQQLRAQEIEADKVGSATAGQLDAIRRRQQQTTALRSSALDPSWSTAWDQWTEAERNAGFGGIDRAAANAEGSQSVGAANSGLLGSGMVAQGRGEIQAQQREQKDGLARNLAEQKIAARNERETQVRDILAEVLTPSGLDDVGLASKLNAFRQDRGYGDSLRANDAQYNQAMSDALSSAFRGVGQAGAAGFQSASTYNAGRDPGTPARTWFDW
jgi:hypothetical protein